MASDSFRYLLAIAVNICQANGQPQAVIKEMGEGGTSSQGSIRLAMSNPFSAAIYYNGENTYHLN